MRISENFVFRSHTTKWCTAKQSLLGKMPGDDWQQFANLRALFRVYVRAPGKKLLFMGGEFAQWVEWNHDRSLHWRELDFAPHRGVRDLVAALNRLYRDDPAFRLDADPRGLWIDCDDASNSVISYQRRNGDDYAIVVLNFTPVPRHQYRLGVPESGAFVELLNTDSSYYGGSNLGNAGRCVSEPIACMGHADSLVLTLPPLAAIVLKPARAARESDPVASSASTCVHSKRHRQFPRLRPRACSSDDDRPDRAGPASVRSRCWRPRHSTSISAHGIAPTASRSTVDATAGSRLRYQPNVVSLSCVPVYATVLAR